MSIESMTNAQLLDDSLTSIQWLCQLDSNKMLDDEAPDSKQTGKDAATTAKKCQLQENVEKNPYPKPHYSYATLIVFAINSSAEKRMTLQEIYTWIQENYPYYRLAKKGWKNSIRHNLSLHKFFVKEKRPPVLHGKGSFWRISPEGKENLMRDLLKQYPQTTLRPPGCALLPPHDPNRKLRPIMPKPLCGNGVSNNGSYTEPRPLRYVPFLTCNLPVVFVPSPAAAMPSTACTTQAVGSSSSAPEGPKSFEVAPQNTDQEDVQGSTLETKISDIPSQVEDQACALGTEQPAHPSAADAFRTPPPKRTRASPPDYVDSGFHAKRKTSSSGKRAGKRSNKSSNSKQLPNILRRKRRKSKQARSPESSADACTRNQTPRRVQTPRRAQPTLAAINSSHVTSSPRHTFDELVISLTSGLSSSPVMAGHNSSFDFLNAFGSPGFSPLRSPTSQQFAPRLTPTSLHHDTDSGILVTPFKSGLSDISLNWTPLRTGLTPLHMSSPSYPNQSSSCGRAGTSQGCRKSLGLE